MARQFSGAALEQALQNARLEVPPDRAALVGATAEGLYAAIDGLDNLELGETPPATAFDARWE